MTEKSTVIDREALIKAIAERSSDTETTSYQGSLDLALQLGACGFSVIPVNGSTVTETKDGVTKKKLKKSPLPTDWGNVAQSTPDGIRELWTPFERRRCPFLVGIACKKSRVWVLDVDTVEHNADKDGIAELAKLEAKLGALPKTFTSRTQSGGLHYFFKEPADGTIIPGNASKIAPGIDVRGNCNKDGNPNGSGFQAIAPGNVIMFQGELRQWKLIEAVEPVEAPEAWIQYIRDIAYNGKGAAKKKSTQPALPTATASATEQPQDVGAGQEPAQPDDPFGAAAASVPAADGAQPQSCGIASVPWSEGEKRWLEKYVNGAIASIARDIANTQEGERDTKLYGSCGRVWNLIHFAEIGSAQDKESKPIRYNHNNVKLQLLKAGTACGLPDDVVREKINRTEREAAFPDPDPIEQLREKQWIYADVSAKQWGQMSDDEKLEFAKKPKKLKDGGTVPAWFYLTPWGTVSKVTHGSLSTSNPTFDSNLSAVAKKLKVLGRGCDNKNENWGVAISWTDRRNHEHAAFLEDITLLSKEPLTWFEQLHGLILESRYPSDLAEYLRKYETNNGWTTTFKGGWLEVPGSGNEIQRAFVLPTRSIRSTGMEPAVLLRRPENDPFTCKGTLPDWSNTLGRWSVGNTRLTTALCLAFAGHILPLLNAEPIGIHFHGNSSAGKSVMTTLAGSVIGYPGKGGCVESWRTTDNAFEGTASTYNDTLLCMDEINSIEDLKALSNILYMAGNGQGKKRANRSGGLRATKYWQVCVLSNGEENFEDFLRNNKMQVKAGQLIRLMSLEADAGKGMGVFDVLPDGFKSPSDFMDAIKAAALKYHGIPRDVLCQYLADNWDTATAELKQWSATAKARMESRYSQDELAGQTGRGLSKFATMAAAGELAAKLKIVPWDGGYATQVIADKGGIFDQWVFQRGGTGQQEDKQTCEFFTTYLQKHPQNFREIGDAADATATAREPLKEQAGFKETTMEGTTYILTTAQFEDLCREGKIGAKAAAAHLQKAGYIQRCGNRWQTKRVLPGMGRQWVRLIKLPEAPEEDTPTATSTAVDEQREQLKAFVGGNAPELPQSIPAPQWQPQVEPVQEPVQEAQPQPQIQAAPASAPIPAPIPAEPEQPQPTAPASTAEGTPAPNLRRKGAEQWGLLRDWKLGMRAQPQLDETGTAVVAAMGGWEAIKGIPYDGKSWDTKGCEFVDRYCVQAAQPDSPDDDIDIPLDGVEAWNS